MKTNKVTRPGKKKSSSQRQRKLKGTTTRLFPNLKRQFQYEKPVNKNISIYKRFRQW